MTWSEYASKHADYSWIEDLLGAIEWVLWVALILVGACGAVYAIYVGVKMARAESSDQREEAKKRLINIIVAIVVTIALILFFNIILPLILNSFDLSGGETDLAGEGGEGQGGQGSTGGTSLATIVNTARVLLRI